jgi:hypothetical protein
LAAAKLSMGALASYREAGLRYAASCSREDFVSRLAKSIAPVSEVHATAQVFLKPQPTV